MSDKKTNYDIESNSGRGIKWNAGAYVKATDGTLYLKGVELNFKNSSDVVKFNIDADGNVDITGDYLVNGSPISGGSLDLSALTAKTTPVDADLTLVGDSAASFANKKVTWANIKATLKTYFDSLYESLTNKDASGGYAGLTLFKINFKNAANTFTSFFTNTNTAARTYTFQDRDGTIIDNTNLVTGSTDNAIIRADGTGGKTTQSSGVSIDDSNNIVLPTTAAGATTGIVYKGSTPYIHNYYPSGKDGHNIFAGLNSGNLSLSGASAFNGSYNTGYGENSLNALTTGYQNASFGYASGDAITTGAANLAMGTYALRKVTTQNNNTSIGSYSGQFVTGSSNMFLGGYAGQGSNGNSSVSDNVGVGFASLNSVRTGGDANTCLGFRTGQLVTSGANNIFIGYQTGNLTTTGSTNIIIGDDIDASSATASNEINIGGRIFAGRSGSPESVVTANVGSMYLRSDGGAGTTLYIKESGTGNTGWVAK